MGRLLALSMLAGCTMMKPYAPAHATSQADDAALYKQAVRVMEDKGFVVESKDRDAGTVTTEWAETSLNTIRTRFRWRVTVGDGEVTVTSQCEQWEQEAFGSDHWSKCENQPEARMTDGSSMAAEIAAAKPSPARKPDPAPAAPTAPEPTSDALDL